VNQNYIQNATLDGQLYTAVGDLSLYSKASAGCIFFNIELADEHYASLGGAEGIYQLVKDGKWTIDKFTEIVKDKWIDYDGDDKRSTGDLYGFGSSWDSSLVCNAFQFGMDVSITQKDENKIPRLSYNNAKNLEAFKKLYTLAHDCEGVYTNAQYYNDNSYFTNAFINSKMIFHCGPLTESEKFKNEMKDEYGILPMPKFDEAQEGYYTTADSSYLAFVILEGIEQFRCFNSDFTRDYLAGAVLEKLNEESYKHVRPNLCEVVLKYRWLQSDRAEDHDLANLDLIIDGCRFDFGYIYSNLCGNISINISKMIRKDANNDFEATWSNIPLSVESKFNQLISFFNQRSGNASQASWNDSDQSYERRFYEVVDYYLER